jgi:hypothetical protein
MSKPTYNVITPSNLDFEPEKHEQRAAKIMADYLKQDVKFVRRSPTSRTADIVTIKTNVYWEIKGIKGNGKRTIQNNLRESQHQAKNLILELSRTNLTVDKVVGRVKEATNKKRYHIKNAVIITKSKKVIDISDII